MRRADCGMVFRVEPSYGEKECRAQQAGVQRVRPVARLQIRSGIFGSRGNLDIARTGRPPFLKFALRLTRPINLAAQGIPKSNVNEVHGILA